MERIPVDEAGKTLTAVVEKVVSTHEPVVITTEQGDAARIVPIPKPIRVVNGRPVYKVEDLQYLDVPPY